MAGRYAATTEVSSERSRAELERLVQRYGASSYAYGWDDTRNMAVVSFRMHNRHLRIRLPLPGRDDPEFTTYRQGRTEFLRTATEAARRYEQAVRQRWRALVLIVKANLEAIELGILDFDTAMLPWLLLPSGDTVADFVAPQVDAAYRTGQMPALLPGLGEALGYQGRKLARTPGPPDAGRSMAESIRLMTPAGR